MTDSLSLVFGVIRSMHFAKFPIVRFSKHYSFNSLHQISTKLYANIAYHGGIQVITLLGNRPSFTNLWHFEILSLGQWENLKCGIS